MTSNVVNLMITLFLVSFFTRVGPTFIGDFLQKQKWMKKLSKYLPSMILTLLIIHDVEGRVSLSGGSLTLSLISLVTTLIIHLWKRQMILSIVVGVATYALGAYFISH